MQLLLNKLRRTVPEPTSSSRASDAGVAAARMSRSRRTWPLNVDKLC